MTPAARETLDLLFRLTGRHLCDHGTADGGCTFTSADGHWSGTILPYGGIAALLDFAAGGPGVQMTLVDDGAGDWQLVPAR